jgi:aminoglycoside 3-N-acetyltransferase
MSGDGVPGEDAPAVVTVDRLVADLRALGVRPGAVLLAHVSLSRIGWVAGGAPAVVLALEEALGPEGTLVVPVQTWQLCDPAYLADPRVPPASWDAVRAALPPYDPAWTPSRSMGAVAEALRTQPGTRRSAHPHRSFAARGPLAAEILARHDLDDPVGEGSPLAVVHRRDGQVLLLGVGHDKSTSLHLAEARSGLPVTRVPNGAPVVEHGRRTWVTFDEPVVDDADFLALGADLAATGAERRGRVGEADARLVDQRVLVAFAASWFARTRPSGAGASGPGGARD